MSALGSRATAEILGGKILVHVTLAQMFVAQRVSGAKWDGQRLAWSYPAGRTYAIALRKAMPGIQGSADFESLLAGRQVAAPLPAPKPVALPVGSPSRPAQGINHCDETEITVPMPDGLLTKLWRHQLAGVKFCLDRFAAGMRGILLAMSMGTGKSLVFLYFVLALRARRVLILCPLRVVPVWVTQFARHVGIPVVLVALDDEIGSVAKKTELAQEKLKLAEALNEPFICVINYDSAWRSPFAEWAKKIRWTIIGCDEAHKAKSPTGKASKFVGQLARSGEYRVALTGTPMPHNHTDIFGIMRFVDVAILGQYWTSFKATYCQMGGYQGKQIVAPRNMDQLNQRVGRVMFRVGPEVLDLPPETQVNYRCDLSPEGRRVYRELNEFFIAGVKDGTITVTNAMVKVLRLAQLTGGWMKTDDGERVHVDDSKQKLLEDTLDDIGHLEPVVVFCWFHEDLDAVHDACRRLSMKSMELSGRRDDKARWEAGESQVLAVQIKSGGVDVDFTRARYSIFYSLGFSLADYEQAKKRVHRPGQTRPVEHIHLLVKGTVDERIMRALEKRREVIEAILAEIVNNN